MSIYQFINQFGAGCLGGECVDAPAEPETEETINWEDQAS